MVYPKTSVPNKFLLHKTVMISILKPRYIELDYDLLHQKYVVEGLVTSEIARQTFSSTTRVQKALKRVGIPFRKRKANFNRSNLPFGKDIGADGELIDNLKEIEAMKLMHELEEGGFSLYAIARELKKKGIKTKKGNIVWRYYSIRRAIDRYKKTLL